MAKRLEIELSKQMEPEQARNMALIGSWEMEQRARRWAAHKGSHPEEWWDMFLPQAALPDEGKVIIRDGAVPELADESSKSAGGGESAAETMPNGQVSEKAADVEGGTVEERTDPTGTATAEKPIPQAVDPDGETADLSGKSTLPMDKTASREPIQVETDFQTDYAIKEYTPKEFVAAREYIPEEFRGFLTWHTPEALREHKVYLIDGQKAGYALDPNGDLQNVFNASGIKHLGDELLADALARGATTLDCIGDGLRDLYENAGFEVVKVLAWDDNKAPMNWDYERWGRPSIYIMRYKEDLSREKSDVGRRIEAARSAKRKNRGDSE
jgi:hypothetical protein